MRRHDGHVADEEELFGNVRVGTNLHSKRIQDVDISNPGQRPGPPEGHDVSAKRFHSKLDIGCGNRPAVVPACLGA